MLRKSGSWFRDEHGRPKTLARKVFGKPPWYRRESGDMTSSVSSSIHELLRGRTPPPTPVKEYVTPGCGFMSAITMKRGDVGN